MKLATKFAFAVMFVIALFAQSAFAECQIDTRPPGFSPIPHCTPPQPLPPPSPPEEHRVPEPGTLALIAIGLVAVARRRA